MRPARVAPAASGRPWAVAPVPHERTERSGRIDALLKSASRPVELASPRRDASGEASSVRARVGVDMPLWAHLVSGGPHRRRSMDRVRWCGRLAALLTIGMLAGMNPAQAAIVKPASPVHTAAPQHRHPRHRHHRRPQAAALTMSRLPSHPVDPAPPARPREHHRATLPALVHGPRHMSDSKAGASRAAVPSASGGLLAVVVRTLEVRQNEFPDAREHPVTGGRGPPRGSPTTPSVGRPSSAFVSAARHAPPGASAASNDPHRSIASAAPPLRLAVSAESHSRFVVSPRLPLGRLHAVRPEGATTCFTMPSSGGSPCPA
jgi:hypothetical protein